MHRLSYLKKAKESMGNLFSYALSVTVLNFKG